MTEIETRINELDRLRYKIQCNLHGDQIVLVLDLINARRLELLADSRLSAPDSNIVPAYPGQIR